MSEIVLLYFGKLFAEANFLFPGGNEIAHLLGVF